jgi:peptidylprolyl isomerase
MKQAAKGNNIKVHYTGKLDDGTVFDSSREREPLEFTLGNGQLIKGFEDAVDGMSAGEAKTFTIPSEETYGTRREDLVLKVGKDQFPQGIDPVVGNNIHLRQPDGGVLNVTITDVSDESVTLDANHPLAGKDLTFEVEVVEVG